MRSFRVERSSRPRAARGGRGPGRLRPRLRRLRAIVTDAVHAGTLGTVGVALVFGLVIMAMVYATGPSPGAHLNPAVTLAFVLTRHFPRREALAYIAAQLAGAVGLDALFGGPVTGASMNPARSLGPALVSGELHDLWIYLAAPVAGAALAYQLVRGEQPA